MELEKTQNDTQLMTAELKVGAVLLGVSVDGKYSEERVSQIMNIIQSEAKLMAEEMVRERDEKIIKKIKKSDEWGIASEFRESYIEGMKTLLRILKQILSETSLDGEEVEG